MSETEQQQTCPDCGEEMNQGRCAIEQDGTGEEHVFTIRHERGGIECLRQQLIKCLRQQLDEAKADSERCRRAGQDVMKVVRSEREIDDVLNWAADAVDTGRRSYPVMSYEEGVEGGIRWLLGETDNNPMDE